MMIRYTIVRNPGFSVSKNMSLNRDFGFPEKLGCTPSGGLSERTVAVISGWIGKSGCTAQGVQELASR